MKALIISAGGNKSSYGVGVLKYLIGDLKTQYKLIAGTSAGALNAAFLAQYKDGEEVAAINDLEKLWLSINNSKIYEKFPIIGKLTGLIKSSFVNSNPLINLIENNINLEKIRSSGKIVYVSAVSLSSGKLTIFNHNSDNFVKAVCASASFPGMFAPIKIGNELFTDGAIKEYAPIKTAIEFGANEIDAIITNPEIRIKSFPDNPSAVEILKRTTDLSADKILANDLEKVDMHNRLVLAGLSNKKFVKLNVYRPMNNLIGDTLNFDPEIIAAMIEKGYNDTVLRYINK